MEGWLSPSAALKHSPESSILGRAALQDAKLCTVKVPGHPRPCTADRSFTKTPRNSNRPTRVLLRTLPRHPQLRLWERGREGPRGVARKRPANPRCRLEVTCSPAGAQLFRLPLRGPGHHGERPPARPWGGWSCGHLIASGRPALPPSASQPAHRGERPPARPCGGCSRENHADLLSLLPSVSTWGRAPGLRLRSAGVPV